MEFKQALQEKCKRTEDRIGELKGIIRCCEARCRGFEETLQVLPTDGSVAPVRKRVEDKLKKERQMAAGAQEELLEVEALLSAYEEAVRLFEKDEDAAPELRAGSELHRVRSYMLERRTPVGLGELLAHLGKADTAETRNSLRGSLSRYARTGSIFVKTAPNTFGLVELGHNPEDQLGVLS